MDSDKAIGAGILIGVAAAVIAYFGFFYLGYGFEVVAIVVSVGFILLLGILGWIGSTMLSTPSPEPLEEADFEEIEEEIEEENEETIES